MALNSNTKYHPFKTRHYRYEFERNMEDKFVEATEYIHITHRTQRYITFNIVRRTRTYIANDKGDFVILDEDTTQELNDVRARPFKYEGKWQLFGYYFKTDEDLHLH